MRLSQGERGQWSVATTSYAVEVVHVLLINDRDEAVRDLISPHVHGDLGGAGVPRGDERTAFTAIGLDLELEPSGQLELRVGPLS